MDTTLSQLIVCGGSDEPFLPETGPPFSISLNGTVIEDDMKNDADDNDYSYDNDDSSSAEVISDSDTDMTDDNDTVNVDHNEIDIEARIAEFDYRLDNNMIYELHSNGDSDTSNARADNLVATNNENHESNNNTIDNKKFWLQAMAVVSCQFKCAHFIFPNRAHTID